MIVPGGVDSARLRALVIAELKKAGLKHRAKKTIFKNVKDMKTVFGAPLDAVALRAVSCCGSSLNVPAVVVELCSELRENAHVEGIFRKAGSASRQKDIRRLLDCGGSVSAAGAHPVDVASLLKLYLRTLPEPLVSAEVQELLLRCRLAADAHHASDEHLTNLLHTLMLLPVPHLHLLHYVTELLNMIASRHKENLMDATNLAIVMTPSIMPLPNNTTSAQRLEHHVALVKIFIENSKHIGNLTEDLLSQLDGDEVSIGQTRRKKRRSSSLNRVLNGLRKMVGGGDRTAQTPARDNHFTRTPIISKSAAKRKLDPHEGFSAKTKNEITKNLPHKELSFTPKKMGTTERKKLRLSMMDTPLANEEMACESSVSSEDLLTSPEHLFSAHDTIDLSDSKQPEKDYVKIPKQEFEEIKSRVSAIESRLSKDWHDVPVQPLQKVQNVYERTLEDVAALNYSSSDQLARRLSKELNIRPNNQHKIIRSPSARKIGTIRRRSKENVTKLVRHKSWNVSTQSQINGDTDRFYPYIGLKRGRPNTMYTGLPERKRDKWNALSRDTSPDDTDNVRRSHISRRQSARENVSKPLAPIGAHARANVSEEYTSPQGKHKWRNAAGYFMERTGEGDNIAQSGRPSVNKLRSQNAGAVLAKARLFESSSDKSSEKVSGAKIQQTGFARRPRISNPQLTKSGKCTAPPVLKVKPNSAHIIERSDSDRQSIGTSSSKNGWNTSDELKKDNKSPARTLCRSPPTPAIKKPLSVKSPRTFRTPLYANEPRRVATPLRAAHSNTSPRRHSPRLKAQRSRH